MESKACSGTPPDGGSDFGCLFEAAMGGPIALALSKPHFAFFEKVEFWLHLGFHFGVFGHPWGSCWAPVGTQIGKSLVQKVIPKKDPKRSHARNSERGGGG